MANATALTIIFGGLNAPKDLADLERLWGTRPTRRTTTHRGERNHRSATESWDREPVLRVEDLRTLPTGRSLLLWGTLPPILDDQRLLGADREWKQLRQGETAWRAANDAAAARGERWAGQPAAPAAELTRHLDQFVSYLNSRHAWSSDQTIPPCWTAHGALVEELTTLMWSR